MIAAGLQEIKVDTRADSEVKTAEIFIAAQTILNKIIKIFVKAMQGYKLKFPESLEPREISLSSLDIQDFLGYKHT